MQPENTTSRQEAILNSLAQGATRTDAAHAAGIHRRTLYNWIEQDPAFKQAVEDAEEECIDIARGLAFDCAMQAQEDPRYLRALFFYLKCKAGWSDRPQRQSAAVSPDLIKEIAAEVIHTLQTLGLVPAKPTHAGSTTEPQSPETPEKHVQSVQSVQSTAE
ncbi:MAG TPA: helix-turn-helix domain-containing protein, partial [Rhodothermales bacterium]|nr:helix-turn-helix domain-containing protein [Rhodothermales bacterium]